MLQKESGDLIRLDSTPSDEDFDPLCSKGKAATAQPVSQTLPMAAEGLTNPLYPYFVPTIGKTSSSHYTGNQSFLYSQPHRHLNIAGNIPEQRVQDSSSRPSYGALFPSSSNALGHGRCNIRDMDLLKEYGLDFQALSLKNGGASLRPRPSASLSSSTPSMSSAVASDPYENLVEFSDSKVKNHPKDQWTKFE